MTHLQMASNPTVFRSRLQRGAEQSLPDVLWGPKRSHLWERNTSTGCSVCAEEDVGVWGCYSGIILQG